MKKYLLSILSAILAVCSGVGVVLAQEEEAAITFAPVEILSCNYNDGKGPQDLAKAVAA